MASFITVDEVKQALWADPFTSPATFDDLLSELIADVCSRIDLKRGAPVVEASYTEYIDGSGGPSLILRRGPLVSVTQVDEIAYSDAGDGSQEITPTEVEPYNYVLCGLRSDGNLATAWIESLGSVWTAGQKNYKVQYTAGFAADAIPGQLRRAAIKETVADFVTRDLEGLMSVGLGEYRIAALTPDKREDALDRAIASFRIIRF